MKKHTLIPAIIALVILLGGPFGLGSRCDSDPRGGLRCLCCADQGPGCTMISCSGCCGGQGGQASPDRWSPEMVPASRPEMISLRVVAGLGETAIPPQSVCLDVPKKPPRRA